MGLGLPYALLYIGKPRGRNVTQKNPKVPLAYSFPKGNMPYGSAMWSSMVELHSWPATLGGGPPHEVPCPPSPSRSPFWNFQKGAFPKISKSAFTIHDDIFQRPNEMKIFMWA